MRTAPPSLPGAHALWAAGLANCFQFLRVSASITDGTGWRPIYMEPNITLLEVEHGVEKQRAEYNRRLLAEARRKRRAILGSHAGLSDWFVPIIAKNKVEAILVTGPFSTARPTSTDLLERWRWLTGRQGHPADPEFAYYVSMTLSVLTLKAEQVANFEKLLTRLARLMSGEQPARRLLTQADSLWYKLEESRLVERTWDAAREMVDERTTNLWAGSHQASGRELFGLPRPADQVAVALFVNRRSDPEPVDDLLRRDGLQRACTELARQSGYAISGRVGDHGVTFLSAATGTHSKNERACSIWRTRLARLPSVSALGCTSASAPCRLRLRFAISTKLLSRPRRLRCPEGFRWSRRRRARSRLALLSAVFVSIWVTWFSSELRGCRRISIATSKRLLNIAATDWTPRVHTPKRGSNG